MCDYCKEQYDGNCGAFNISGIGDYICCLSCAQKIQPTLVYSGQTWDYEQTKYVTNVFHESNLSYFDDLYYPTASFLALLDEQLYRRRSTLSYTLYAHMQRQYDDVRDHHVHPCAQEMIDIRDLLQSHHDKNIARMILEYFSMYTFP
jgi:hypothetical protein